VSFRDIFLSYRACLDVAGEILPYLKSMNELTVIIPFLNEGQEVEKTLRSIRDTAGEEVDILLVNDCSTDGTDYERVARKYGARYIVNSRQQGVARSRDIGVESIHTPWFILLDGHMRFYDNRWHLRAVECLREDDRAVYCFRCGVLSEDRESVTEIRSGAWLSLYGESHEALLSPLWRNQETHNPEVEDIPCVLGASYSMSKRYWGRLKGLAALRYYGSDEAYLSLKVWLEGGRCRLIGDVVAGHLFRTNTQRPYDAYNTDFIYNKLLIAETILPRKYALYLHASLKALAADSYYAAVALLHSLKPEIDALRAYYRTIFTRDFASFEAFNAQHSPPAAAAPDFVDMINSNLRGAAGRKTDEIAEYLMAEQPPQTAGLMVGGLGEIIFLYHHARARGDMRMKAAIDRRLSELLDTADLMHHYNVFSGAAGTGLGLIHLNEQGFIEMDIAQVLSTDVEGTLLKYMHRDIERSNFGFLQGAAGVGYYFLRRGNPKYLPAVEALIMRMRDAAPADGTLGLLLPCEAHRMGVPAAYDIIKNFTRQERDGSLVTDLAVGLSLLHAGGEWRDAGIEILLSTLGRRDFVQERVKGAGLETGTSGIAATYRAAYRQTGIEAFNDAAEYWTKQTLYMAMNDVVPAGYKPHGTTNTDYGRSLLRGIAGIGLWLSACGEDVVLAQ
jgi:glycosyltransferase involved in cell wall biosynthesis